MQHERYSNLYSQENLQEGELMMILVNGHVPPSKYLLWLPLILNLGQSRQCTYFSHAHCAGWATDLGLCSPH